MGGVSSQPINWLAIPIPSLRDFYTCRRHLTRRIAPLHARRALHGTTCPYPVPTGLLHGATAPLHDAKRPYTRQRRHYTAAPPPLEVSKKLACQPPPTFKNSAPKNIFPQIRPYFGKVPNSLSISNLASRAPQPPMLGGSKP